MMPGENIFEVCCVGHMCIDVLAKPVDKLPGKGKLALIDSVHLKTGGCAMNTALGLAKIGIHTAMLGKCGNDAFGSIMKNTLKDARVNIDVMRIAEDEESSVSVVAISEDGERSILHCLGTNATLCFEDIDLNTIKLSKILFIGGTYILPRFDGRDAAQLLQYAKTCGVITAMDTAWDASGKWLSTIEGCLPYLDWFLPSYEEAAEITGKKSVDQITLFLKEKGAKNVAVKLGCQGCYIAAEGCPPFTADAFKVRSVDASGAGDAWCAGFLTGLTKGWDLHKTAAFGNAAGALCVTEIGTTTGIRNLEETLDFLRRNESL